MRESVRTSAARTDGHLHLRVRPAAPGTTATIARVVIGGDVEHVVAWLAERHRSQRAARVGLERFSPFERLELWSGLGDGYFTRAAVLRDGDVDWRRRIVHRTARASA